MVSKVIDISQLSSMIGSVSNDFIFAGILALNRVAWRARRSVQDVMSDIFVIRKKYVLSGVRVKQATKTDRYAEVYSGDWFMPVHEKGGQRKTSDPPSGVKPIMPGLPPLFWLPIRIREAAGLDFKKNIPTSFRPQNILKNKKRINKNKPFLIKKGEEWQIVVRESKDRYPLKMLYIGTKRPIHFKSRRWFYDEIDAAYDSYMEVEYNKALREILTGAIGKKI